MKKRYNQINRAINQDLSCENSNTEDLKSTIRESWGNSYSRTKAGNQINKRVIIYVLALLALAYYIIY